MIIRKTGNGFIEGIFNIIVYDENRRKKSVVERIFAKDEEELKQRTKIRFPKDRR